MIFSTVVINAVRWSVLGCKHRVLNNKLSVLSHVVYIFHLFNVLQTYYTFSHPGWQDSTICGALITMIYDHHHAYNDDDDYDR